MEIVDYLEAIFNFVIEIKEANFQFIIEFGSAWNLPLVAIVIAITLANFRDPITDLIKRIRRFKVPNVFEADVHPSRDLLELREQLETSSAREIEQPTEEREQPTEEREQPAEEREQPAEEPGQLIDESFLALASISPRYAVIDAWRFVEHCIFRLAEESEPTSTRHRRIPVRGSMRALAQRHALPDYLLMSINRMNDIRNNAVHDQTFSVSEGFALDFADTAQQVVALLEEAIKKEPE